MTTLSGCAASPSEKVWQGLHAIDVAQTFNGSASDPCFRESGWDTEFVIGSKPSKEAVIAWGAASGFLHYKLDRWLENTGRDDKIGWKIFRAIDLSYKGVTVGRNHGIGVRPFGDNNCPLRR